jgi:flagellar assembly protein FliH
LIKKSVLPNPDGREEYLIDSSTRSSGANSARKGKGPSLEDTARSIIAAAKEEAQAIVDAASEEADAIGSAAYQEGYQNGLQELEAERQFLAEKILQVEADAEAQINEFWTSIEPELLRLSVEIARKVIRQHVDENQATVLTTVKEGLRQLRDRQDLKLHVNPADYEYVREHKEEIASTCDGIRNLQVVDDRRVDPGGCLIETSNGDLDARIETQLAEVGKSFLEAA